MRAPELLAPAGTLKNLKYAFAYGADAVYAGMPRYSLRVRNNEFLSENLEIGIQAARALGKRFYLTCNLLCHGAKLKTFMEDIEPVIDQGPDALIMADPGLIMCVRERWPALPIHLSVQANTLNAAAVRFWRNLGLRRIILSRELSLDEIEDIRQSCPDVELEVFVHGALCIAYSGRCLLSGYFNHREANQGVCTNSCRWQYRLYGDKSGMEPGANAETGGQTESDRRYYLEESERPGELMPVFEDDQGTYIMNSRDLRAVEHVARLASIGVDSLKIEGRTKSHYYVARAVQVYRQAIDDAMAGVSFRASLLRDLEGLANRGYTEGFYRRHGPGELQNYETGSSESDRQIFAGEVRSFDEGTGEAEIEVKNKIRVGDELELITPEGNQKFNLEAMEDLEGRSLSEAPGVGYRVRMALPVAADAMGLIARKLENLGSEQKFVFKNSIPPGH